MATFLIALTGRNLVLVALAAASAINAFALLLLI